LPHYKSGAASDNRQIAHPELQQPLAPSRRVDNVDRFKIDTLTRKKLFRP
jgi:hypothetical protein